MEKNKNVNCIVLYTLFFVFLSDDRFHDLCMYVHNNIIVNVCARHKYQLEVISTTNKRETVLVFKSLMIIKITYILSSTTHFIK